MLQPHEELLGSGRLRFPLRWGPCYDTLPMLRRPSHCQRSVPGFNGLTCWGSKAICLPVWEGKTEKHTNSHGREHWGLREREAKSDTSPNRLSMQSVYDFSFCKRASEIIHEAPFFLDFIDCLHWPFIVIGSYPNEPISHPLAKH